MMVRKTVLIVGASGLVGTAAAISFAAPAGLWLQRHDAVRAAGRCQHRLRPDGFYRTAEACAAVCGKLRGITHVVYTAVYELPGIDQAIHLSKISGNVRMMLENLLVAYAKPIS